MSVCKPPSHGTLLQESELTKTLHYLKHQTTEKVCETMYFFGNERYYLKLWSVFFFYNGVTCFGNSVIEIT